MPVAREIVILRAKTDFNLVRSKFGVLVRTKDFLGQVERFGDKTKVLHTPVVKCVMIVRLLKVDQN